MDKVGKAECRLERQQKLEEEQQAHEILVEGQCVESSVKPRSRPRRSNGLPRDANPQQAVSSVHQVGGDPTLHKTFLSNRRRACHRGTGKEQTLIRRAAEKLKATKSSQQAKSSRSWVKMWIQLCMLLCLLNGVDSTALFSAPRQAHPQWNVQDTYQQLWLGNRTKYPRGPEEAREQEQDLRLMQTQRYAGQASEEWKDRRSASHRPHGLSKWPNVARRSQNAAGQLKTSGKYGRLRAIKFEGRSVNGFSIGTMLTVLEQDVGMLNVFGVDHPLKSDELQESSNKLGNKGCKGSC